MCRGYSEGPAELHVKAREYGHADVPRGDAEPAEVTIKVVDRFNTKAGAQHVLAALKKWIRLDGRTS